MEGSTDNEVCATLKKVRLILIGGRWSGKSMSANTILRSERFESGRIRTVQAEVRRGLVEGRKLIVVDGPGWQSSFSLTEIPEGYKLKFRLNASKCPPGPHAFLLVIPIDTAFTVDQRKTVEEHIKLLGEQTWRHTLVLFTCGDSLMQKTIEQHIESEGEPLKRVVEKCRNRYHVFNNKDTSNSSQVSLLLEKIDQMVWHNNGDHYKVDEETMKIIEKRQQEVAVKAEERSRMVEEQNQQMKALISEKLTHVQNLRMVLLGSRNVGKTSVLNTILGFKEREMGQKTMQSVVHQGCVNTQQMTLVDTPGWWKVFAATDTPEAIKDEIRRSVFLCQPGPHVFLLMIDADASFNALHKNAVTTHLELLGKDVWSHTIVVFTRGDWLGHQTIEQYIEGEGKALQSLVEQCGNRYHVLDNKNESDTTQVTELLDKIIGIVTEKDGEHFTTDEEIFRSIEVRRRAVEDGAAKRQFEVSERRKSYKGSLDKLQEMKIALLGQKAFGKTATGNAILRKDVLASHRTEQCQVDVANVAGRLVTVIDSPGWWEDSSRSTEETDKETVQGLLISPSGVHVVLLVIPLDLKFREANKSVLKEYLDFFDASVWNHTMVLFTYGDRLADKSVEEHIEREHRALRWLVEKCDNRYHVLNNLKKNDISQVTELFEKIEEIVTKNHGRIFCPNKRDVHLRIEENARKRLVKFALMQQVSRKELEMLKKFKEFLTDLQTDIRGSATKTKTKFEVGELPKLKVKVIGQRKKDEKDELLAKIGQEIDALNQGIMRLSKHLQSSKEFPPPDMEGEKWTDQRSSTVSLNRIHEWLYNLQSNKDVDHQTTLNFSLTSGYRSENCGNFDWDDVF